MCGVPAQELIDLQIIDPASVEPYYHRVRDRDDVRVLRCARSGVIFLDRTDHIGLPHYEDMAGTSYWGVGTFEQALSETREDDERRAQAVQDLFGARLSHSTMVDVGCGTGGTMDLLKNKAASV